MTDRARELANAIQAIWLTSHPDYMRKKRKSVELCAAALADAEREVREDSIQRLLKRLKATKQQAIDATTERDRTDWRLVSDELSSAIRILERAAALDTPDPEASDAE